MPDSTPRNLFISYAREDMVAARSLYSYLRPLIMSGRLNVFFDTESIEKGGPWEEKIDSQLREADAFIFLVSRHYFDSEYVIDKELPGMIRRYRDEHLKCWPFLVSYYPWEDFEFEGVRLASIQAIGPFDAQQNLVPLNSLSDYEQDVQFSHVYSEVRDWIDKLDRQEQEEHVAPAQQAAVRPTSDARQTAPQDLARTQPEKTRRRKASQDSWADSGERKRDAWDKLEILLRPMGALFVALTLALLGYFYQQSMDSGRDQAGGSNGGQSQDSEYMLSQQAAEIDALLMEARRNIERNLLDPALEVLQRIKRLQPDQADADVMLMEIFERTVDEIKQALASGDLDRALAYRDRARRIAGDSPELQKILQELEQAIDEARVRGSRDQPAREERIAALLAEANQHIDADRLTSPPGDNALEILNEVRQLDPDNNRAEETRRRILERYFELAEQAVARQDFDGADRFLDKAETVDADSGRLANMRVYVKDARRKAALVNAGKLSGTPTSVKPGEVFQDALTSGGKGPQMVVIPAGSFIMGSPESELGRQEDEGPRHEVRIRSFALGRTEVTFDEYDAFAKATNRELPHDEGWGRGRRPVINVSWNDAVAYADWLSDQTGKHYRLPTEAEWEYAARAGSSTRFHFGDNEAVLCDYANHADRSTDYSWSNKSCDDGVGIQTATVGRYQPNQFGLHDIHGNVWEWVQDCWHASYRGAPIDGSVWLEEDEGNCGSRVLRGGSWAARQDFVRSAFRFRGAPGDRGFVIGFRLASTF